MASIFEPSSGDERIVEYSDRIPGIENIFTTTEQASILTAKPSGYTTQSTITDEIPLVTQKLLIIDGDSLTNTGDLDAADRMNAQLQTRINDSSYAYVDISRGSKTLSNSIDEFHLISDLNIPNGVDIGMFLWLGTNDLAPTGGNVDYITASGYFDTYISNIIACWPLIKIYACTAIARTNDSRTDDLRLYNSLIKQNNQVHQFFDFANIEQFDGYPDMATELENGYYQYIDDPTDTTHLKVNGIDILSAYAAARIKEDL